MKQKQVKASPKFGKQTPKKTPTPKKKQVQESSEEDEEVQQEIVKKPINKKAAKVIKKPVFEETKEESDEEESEEVEQEEDEDASEGEGGEEEEEEKNEDEEMEADEDDDNDNDDGNDDDDDDNDDDNDDDDDDGDNDDDSPAEEAIGKEEPTLPSQVKNGPIHPSVPDSKIIQIRGLRKKCKQIDIVEAFAKYGSIDQIHIDVKTTPIVANVAYKTEKAATAALAGHRKVTVNGAVVSVTREKLVGSKTASKTESKTESKTDSTVYVKYFKNSTTAEDIKKHFESCGEIKNVSLKNKFANVIFSDKSAVPAALKLNNSLLNAVNIRVFEKFNNFEASPELDKRFTILLRNKNDLKSIDVAKLEAIFSKCGEIDNIILVLKKNVLAFIIFKTEQAVQNAIKLSGKTEQGIELEVELYDPLKKFTAIHVTNLPRDCTVDDLTNIFSKAGDIVSIIIRKGYAIVRFVDSDAYCKSFLYNESFIKGNAIFIEPHSHRKQTAYKFKKTFPNKGFKRPAKNGHTAFVSKKLKKN